MSLFYITFFQLSERQGNIYWYVLCIAVCHLPWRPM